MGRSEEVWAGIGFGERVRRLREAHGLSQGDLAEGVGCHRNEVGSWERGVYVPTLGMLESLCRALDVTPNELLGWVEQPKHKGTGNDLQD